MTAANDYASRIWDIMARNSLAVTAHRLQNDPGDECPCDKCKCKKKLDKKEKK